MEKPEIKKEKDIFVEKLAIFLRPVEGEFDAIIQENIKQQEPYPTLLFNFIQPYAGISSVLFIISTVGKPNILSADNREKVYTITINNRYHVVFSDFQKIEDAIKTAFFDSWKNIESEIASLIVRGKYGN